MKRFFYQAIKRIVNSQKKYAVLSFIVPFLLFLLAFAVQQVHPFGSRTILSVDSYHQYAPFLVELRNKLLSGESLFHSWHIGLGTNFWAVFANYAASPLNVLMLFFPTKFIPDGIALLVCLRAGLAGIFMSFLLRDIDHGRKDFFLVAFSSFYVISGWVLAYYWNIMWMDAVVFLPLVVLGLRRLLRDGKPLLYCFSLFLCLWSNFFTGYFICLFLIVFAPVCYISIVEKKSFKHFSLSVGRFALYSCLAAAMAAVILLPTYLTLSHASATGDRFPSIYLTQDMFDFFSRLMLTATPNIRDGLANVYSGVPVLLFLPLFFISRKIRLSEKIAYGTVLLFIYYGFAARVMDFIWHGFHFPNQIPHRQSFLMTFVLIIIAYRVLRNLSSYKLSDIMFSVALILGYILIYPKIGTGKEGFRVLALTALFVIVYAVIVRAIILSSARPRRVAYAFLGIMLIELVVSSQVTIGLVASNEGFPSWDFYGKNTKEVSAFLEEREADSDLGPFVRAEIFPHHSCNQAALYEMKGISVFSSTARESFVRVMRSWGLHNNTINSTRVFGVNEVTSTLLGLRYFVDLEEAPQMPTAFDANEFEQNGLRIRENPNALSLGYMVNEDVLNYNPEYSSNPFNMTNIFLEHIGASPVYEMAWLEVVGTENFEFSSGNPYVGYSFSMSELSQPGMFEFSVEADLQDRQLYLFTTSNDSGRMTTYYGNDQEGTYHEVVMPFTRRQIIDAGRYANGDMQSVRLNWDSSSHQNITVYAYSVNEDAYREMVDVLSTSQLVIDSYDSTHIDGHIHVQEEGLLLLTITYDEGWRAKVNGEPAEIINVAGAFCGILLPEGTHEISMEYVPEGFYMGLIISCAAFVFLSVLTAGSYLLKKKRCKEQLGAGQKKVDEESTFEEIMDNSMEQESD